MDTNTSNYEVPGAWLNFEDVTAIFEEASSDMALGEMFFMEGFTLQEAMSAFEIGEPRLDSGLITEEQRRPPFDPLAPLLPEELCWILDRSFAYEMEWHAGNFMAHSVFTLLHVHHLQDIDPDFLSISSNNDPSKPMELVTIVLRSATYGLLKCCDIAWRELCKGAVQDSEDWQSDKCEVSLLEGFSVQTVIQYLVETAIWLTDTPKVAQHWKEALLARILFRKTLLQIMDSAVCNDRPDFHALIDEAQHYLQRITTSPPPELKPDNPAYLTFDPYISRRLNTFVPIRVLEVPSFHETCKNMSQFLQDLRETSHLAGTFSLITWQTVGNLRLWIPNLRLQSPYIRSLTQSTFYNGVLILNKFNVSWVMETFFLETVGIPYETISRMAELDQSYQNSLSRTMYKACHISQACIALWYNPPRRRRHFMKSAYSWHQFYEILTTISFTRKKDLPVNHIIVQLPKVALVWRLSVLRDITLSGFQLDLYAKDERPLAYWYIIHIVDNHLACYDSLLSVVPKGTVAYSEMLFESHWLTALRAMAEAIFAAMVPAMHFNWDRVRPAFYRRYKWAFRLEYDDATITPVGHPQLAMFMQACVDVLTDDGSLSPSDSINFAHTILTDLLQPVRMGGLSEPWIQERVDLIEGLLKACERLRGLSSSLIITNMNVLHWDPESHPWFPSIMHPTIS